MECLKTNQSAIFKKMCQSKIQYFRYDQEQEVDDSIGATVISPSCIREHGIPLTLDYHVRNPCDKFIWCNPYGQMLDG